MQLSVVLNLQSSVRGVVRAALLGVTKYSLNNSIPLVGRNSLAAQLRWNTTAEATVEPWKQGQTVRLQIEATYTKLFTFELVWV